LTRLRHNPWAPFGLVLLLCCFWLLLFNMQPNRTLEMAFTYL